MPDTRHPPFESGALTTPRQLQRWLDVNPQGGPLNRIQKFIVIPVFSVDTTWLGYSHIVAQFNYAASNNFSLKNFTLLTEPNYTCCISYVNSNHRVFRYRLWTAVGEAIYFGIPQYAGQLIKKNFTVEIWSVDGTVVSQAADITILTSVRGSIDYRYGTDSRLVSASSLCEGQQSIGDSDIDPSTVDLQMWFDANEGVTVTGGVVTSWVDRIAARELTANLGTEPSLSLVNNEGMPAPFIELGLNKFLLVGAFTSIPVIKSVYLFAQLTSGAGSQPLRMADDFGNSLQLSYSQPDELNIDISSVNTDFIGNVLNIPCVIEILLGSPSGTIDTINIYNAVTTDLIVTASIDTIDRFQDLVDVFLGNVSDTSSNVSQLIGYSSVLGVSDRQDVFDYLFGLVAGRIILPATWGTCAQPVLNTDNLPESPSEGASGDSYIAHQGSSMNGSIPIANGVNDGIVTGLGLGFVPTSVLVTVSGPTGGLVLYATVDASSLSEDGFNFVLNGITDQVGYILNYEIN